MANPMIGAQGLSDRDLIDFVVSSYFIVDYGFVKSVNDDNTVNVIHAKKPVLMDGTELEETLTRNLEVLTFSCTEFSVSFKPKKGDKVLLLALKDWVKSTADVEKAESPAAFIHYERETMKALPLSAFDSEAKIKITADAGTLKVDANKKIELNGNSKKFVTHKELDEALQKYAEAVSLHTHTCASPGSPSGTPTSFPGKPMTIDISDAATSSVVTGG